MAYQRTDTLQDLYTNRDRTGPQNGASVKEVATVSHWEVNEFVKLDDEATGMVLSH